MKTELDVFDKILSDVAAERERQNTRWGRQQHPNGTSVRFKPLADSARNNCRTAAENGTNTWMHILRKEVWEALSETDRVKLREALIQMLAVGVAWVEHLDESNA